jgi:hypothetical protein
MFRVWVKKNVFPFFFIQVYFISFWFSLQKLQQISRALNFCHRLNRSNSLISPLLSSPLPLLWWALWNGWRFCGVWPAAESLWKQREVKTSIFQNFLKTDFSTDFFSTNVWYCVLFQFKKNRFSYILSTQVSIFLSDINIFGHLFSELCKHILFSQITDKLVINFKLRAN